MLDFIYQHVLIRGFESGIKRRKTYAYWRELENSQWLPHDEIVSLQFDSLKRLLAHAAENCPYYRDAWRSLGLDPSALSSQAGFAHWPMIDRDVIRENRRQIRAMVTGMRLMKKATGGSSGVPLEFDLDTDSHARRHAAWHRGYSWAGAGPGTSQWHLWGQVGRPSRGKRLKDALYYRLYRRKMTNSYDTSEASVSRYLKDLNRCRPQAIVAYTNPLYDFARGLEEHGLRPHSPLSIVVGAEKLHEFQRDLIERVFQAPVFETYGSREFMLIGCECERHSGLHLTMEDLLVEIVDDDGQPTPVGREGNVVITDLTNYGMPFIRYQNGDRAIASSEACPCGRGLPLLKKVVGRRLDILETPDGRHVPGEFFPHLLKDFPAIRQFQVIQDDRWSIRLLVVVNADWNAEVRKSLQDQIHDTVGYAVGLEIAVVDAIPLTPAGKRQVVVRRIRETPVPVERVPGNVSPSAVIIDASRSLAGATSEIRTFVP
ncbi:MAG TPA: phenylacetate--CoA ligase family protein [Planctomycetaceae bacterium]|jgi:phenylacetate-CoA ligase